MTAPRPVGLVLFDLDGTVLDHDGAAAEAVEQWLLGAGWAGAGEVAGLVRDWDEIAERHFPAYRARQTTFQGQRRARLRDFLPRLGLDASTWADDRLDSVFDGYLAAYEAAWRPSRTPSPACRHCTTSSRSQPCPMATRLNRRRRCPVPVSAATSTSC